MGHRKCDSVGEYEVFDLVIDGMNDGQINYHKGLKDPKKYMRDNGLNPDDITYAITDTYQNSEPLTLNLASKVKERAEILNNMKKEKLLSPKDHKGFYANVKGHRMSISELRQIYSDGVKNRLDSIANSYAGDISEPELSTLIDPGYNVPVNHYHQP